MTISSKKTKVRPGKKLLAFDRSIGRFIAGVDEAGRGCLAGPLVAASVVLDLNRLVGPDAAALGQLNDSKLLSQTQREKLYRALMGCARHISIALISPSTIDAQGLHISNIAAMRRALAQIPPPVDAVLVDGFQLDPIRLRGSETKFECQKLIKGDRTSAAIAASAIIAKVTRDRLMSRLDTETGYRWAYSEHYGYATGLHAERIAIHGTSHHHRMSYQARAYEGADQADLPALGSRTTFHLRMGENV